MSDQHPMRAALVGTVMTRPQERAQTTHFQGWIGGRVSGTYPSPDGRSQFRFLAYKLDHGPFDGGIPPTPAYLQTITDGLWEAVEYAEARNISAPGLGPQGAFTEPAPSG